MGKRERNEDAEASGPSKKKVCASAKESRSSRKRGRQPEEEIEEEEEEQLNLSQRPDFSTNAIRGTEAEVGIIEQISLKNFMCHSRLDINFGPGVNYIMGRNGSGKSAILTGLVVGLGGRAKATNRGSSVKEFIKSGKQKAEVMVKLRNRGTDAYRQDVYGDSIIVEKKLATNGTRSIQIKAKDGTLVSTKAKELAHILDQFNIQVDNPVSILNQETSRNFLHSKNACDKYRFFLQATQLEQMKCDYKLAEDRRREAETIIANKEQTLPRLEKEIAEWEQKYKALDSIQRLKDKVQGLKEEMAWALVHSKEQEAEASQHKLALEQKRTPKYKQKVTDCEVKVSEARKKKQEIEKDIKSNSDSASTLDPQIAKARKVRDDNKAAYRNMQIEGRRLKHELASSNKAKEALMEKIEELKNTAQNNYEEEKKNREYEIQRLETELKQWEAKKKTTNHDLEQYKACGNKLKEQAYELKCEDSDLQQQRDQLKRQLHNLESAKVNKMGRFGQWAPNTVQAIDEAYRQGRFCKKPLGPLGGLLSVREGKWSATIEAILKSLLFAFCVDNHNDERELERILQRTCTGMKRRPTIIISAFLDKKHDVSRFKAQSKYPTVQDMLIISDVNVSNCLIDQRGIERVILIESREEARAVMLKHPPKNTAQAYTLQGDRLIHKNTFRFYASNSKGGAKYLSANIEDSIKSYQEEYKRKEQAAQILLKRKRELEVEVRKNDQLMKASQTKLMKIRETCCKLSMECTELKNIEDPEPIDVATLEDDLAQQERDIKEMIEKESHLGGKLSASESELKAAAADLKSLEDKKKAILESVDDVRERLASAEHGVETAMSHKKHYMEKLKEHESKVAELQLIAETKTKELGEDTAKATKYCDKVKTRRTVESLQIEITQINKRIETEEKTQGNYEETVRNYHEKFEAYKVIKQEVGQLKNFLRELDRILGVRQNQYTVFRKMIALRAKNYFIILLSNRDYSGKMNFNHDKEELSLSVQPSATKGEGAKDMKSLSGGERSFSTVCFILALWDAMESPFRCLDEFDVFMDMVNRRISMDMMRDIANQQKERQFIFLTPQDMSHTGPTRPTDRIFKMPDPERGQTVLPFEPESRRRRTEEEED